jgi:glyceraldehyde 3-phosphate dehydrogenase
VIEKTRPIPADFFSDWKEREALSEAMIPLIGSLYREKNISLYMYGKSMVNRSVIELMKAHRFVRQIEQNELSEYETYPLIEALSDINLGPAHIDVGKLAVKYQEFTDTQSLTDFLNEEIGDELDDIKNPSLIHRM